MTNKKQGHPLNIGVIGGLGALILLAILAGTAYVLASSGTGIPVFYTLVSGLKPDGKGAAVDALAYMKSQNSYLFNNKVTLTLKNDKDKPSLPSGSADATTPVFSLAELGNNLYSAHQGAQFLGDQQITVNNGTPISLSLFAQNDTSDPWPVYFADDPTPSITKAASADLQKTLLYPVVRPMSLEQLLGAVKANQSFQKHTTTGKAITVTDYTVSLNPDQLKAAMPTDATLSNPVAIIEVAWKGAGQVANQVVAAKFDSTLTYSGKDYTLEQVWNVTSWQATPPAGASNDLSNLMDTTKTTAASTLSIQDFIAQLAIGKLSLLPNTINQSDGGVQQSSKAATPTGESITTLGTTITSQPTAPTPPASAEAIKRDTQRKQDLALLKTVLEKYKTDTGGYPITKGVEQTVSSTTLFSSLVPKYLIAMPVDPLPSTYWYEYQSDGTNYTLRSVLEDSTDKSGKAGRLYHYYEVTN